MTPKVPRLFIVAFAVGVGANAAGWWLGLYERFQWYDEAIHFSTPVLATPLVYLVLARLAGLPPSAGASGRSQALGAFVACASFGLALAALWELFEYALDNLTSTNLTPGYTDTIVDLALGGSGSAAAAGVVAVWSLTGVADGNGRGSSAS